MSASGPSGPLVFSNVIWSKEIKYPSIVFLGILCTIILAIVLYGRAHPHKISSFICCHEDTSDDHLTRISIYKKKQNRITNRSGRAKMTLNFKASW